MRAPQRHPDQPEHATVRFYRAGRRLQTRHAVFGGLILAAGLGCLAGAAGAAHRVDAAPSPRVVKALPTALAGPAASGPLGATLRASVPLEWSSRIETSDPGGLAPSAANVPAAAGSSDSAVSTGGPALPVDRIPGPPGLTQPPGGGTVPTSGAPTNPPSTPPTSPPGSDPPTTPPTTPPTSPPGSDPPSTPPTSPPGSDPPTTPPTSPPTTPPTSPPGSDPPASPPNSPGSPTNGPSGSPGPSVTHGPVPGAPTH